MTTESGRIATSSSRRRVGTLPADRTVPLLSQACLFCLSLCLLHLSHSQSVFPSVSVLCAQCRAGACVLVPQVRTLAHPAGRCCRMKGQDQDQDQDQDRTGSHLQEAVSPYRQLGAKHGPPTPGPPRIALELPQRQSAVPQQPDNHAAQTSPGSPATIAFPFHHPTLNISPPKPTTPNPTWPRCGNPSQHVRA